MRVRLAAIVDFSDAAVIGNGLNGSIIAWNRGAEKIFGYSPTKFRLTAAEALQHLAENYDHDILTRLLQKAQLSAGIYKQ
jgi:PAS domain S-box-containing protein